MENLEGKSFNSVTSILTTSMESQAILSTCLDVLISIYLDGKAESEKERFLASINNKLKQHREESTVGLVPVER
jgi:hypothetical protein